MTARLLNPVAALQRLQAHQAARCQWDTVLTARDKNGVLLDWEVSRSAVSLTRRHGRAVIARERFPSDPRAHVQRWPIIRELAT